MTADDREREMRLKAASFHEVTPETTGIEDKRLKALLEVMKAEKAVGDAYYAWLDVSEDNNDTDNPEYKAWGEAMIELGRKASEYIDNHVNYCCLSPSNRPKDYQEDAIAKEARKQMGWG